MKANWHKNIKLVWLYRDNNKHFDNIYCWWVYYINCKVKNPISLSSLIFYFAEQLQLKLYFKVNICQQKKILIRTEVFLTYFYHIKAVIQVVPLSLTILKLFIVVCYSFRLGRSDFKSLQNLQSSSTYY